MSQLAKIRHLLRQAVRVHLRPYRGLHVVLALAVLVAVAFELCFPLAIKFLIDAALIPHHLRNFVTAIVVLLILFAASTLARYVLAIIKAYLQNEMNGDLRIVLIRLMQRLPMRFYDQVQPGHFATMFDAEMLTLSGMLQDLLRNGFQAALQLLVIIVTLFILNWQLALAVAVLLPLTVLLPQRRLKPSADATDAMRRNVERINGLVQDHVATQELIHAFGRREQATRQFIEVAVRRKGSRGELKGIADLRRVLRTNFYFAQTFRLSVENQGAGLTLIVIGAGATLSFAGMLSLGTFSAFILFLPKLTQAMSNLAKYVQDMTRATGSLDRFEQLENAALPEPDAGGLIDLPAPTRSIRFEHVAFGYYAGVPFIREVNLTLPVGRSMALVGRSGSGKSTLFKLLLGTFAPVSGRLTIDGHDLSGVNPASLGSHIGTVLQRSILQNTSIRANICFAKPEATDDEVVAAAKLAEIHDYIVSLPKGYDSGVGEGGKWLSEGQKQRIALARAILPDRPILLLDEVTAALDPESEAAINATIQRLAQSRTMIIVTHRLASVTFVDWIAVVDQGEIKEQGSHKALLARDGIYLRLWQMQSGFAVSGDGHRAEVEGARLQAIPLFRDVALAPLEKLAGQFVSELHQPGQAIYQEGQSGDKFFILVRGTVAVTTRDAGGSAIRLANLQDGDYFGEGEVLGRGLRSTTVTASTPSLVLALRAEHFHAMMDELSSLNKIVTQMALGRSLSTICSVGRRRRGNPIWQALQQQPSP